MTQENKVAIPQDVKDKIKERFKLNPDCDPSIRSEHFLAKEFSKDGAEFGYGLAAENLAAKEKEIAKLKEENFQLSAEITSVSDGYDRVELQQEIERLKGLIKESFFKLGGDRFFDWQQFKTENNL